MKNRFVLYSLHGLGWLAFLILPHVFEVRGSVNVAQLAHSRHDVQSLITYMLIILFSYLNYFILVPKLYLERQYGRYAGLVLLCFLVIASVPFWSEPLVSFIPLPKYARSPDMPFLPTMPAGSMPPPPVSGEVTQTVLLLIVSVLVSISVQTNNRLQQIENEKLNAELGQLKAQIHPHFLFNTLNSIYALALRKDDKTADTVVKLSEFMRYMIRDAGNDRVPLEKETNYIRNYIDLQQSRLRDSVKVTYTLTGSVMGWQIVPLILFTFIENAFKHGVNPDEDSEIRIEIKANEQALRLYVFNRKVTVHNPDSDGGLGLQNARARLRLVYPDQHQLTIDDTPTSYTVTLTIKKS